MTQPQDVLYASRLYQEWLGTLKDRAMLETHNQSQAMMRSMLHNLRRHMSNEQVLSFADALPPLPRGIFIEGWRPGEPMPFASGEDLFRDIVVDLAPHHAPPDSIVADVLAVIAEHSSPTAANQMRSQLPEGLRALWPPT